MDKLTVKQRRFVEEYMIDLNGKQAAIRAGYEVRKPDGFYVYFLVDPRCGTIFYVGKGKGQRAHHHERKARAGVVDNPRKFDVIQELSLLGASPEVFIFESLLTEEDAYQLEATLIQAFKNTGITNISGGIEPSGLAAKRQAKEFLTRLKPFDVWMAQASQDQITLVTALHGSPEAWHSNFKKSLQTVAAC